MSNLVIPRREILTQQPTKPSGINLANPLARGVSVWLATSPHVFYGNRNLVAVSESGYNSSPVGKEGVARKWNRAAAAGVDFGTQQIFTGQAVTVMVIAAPTSTVDMKAAFSQRAASGAYPQVDFIFNGSNDGLSASAGTVELVTYDGGSRGVTATSQLDGNVQLHNTWLHHQRWRHAVSVARYPCCKRHLREQSKAMYRQDGRRCWKYDISA